mmetsp:Transcript_21631/g.33067  ORF Transcript_21631/g.33067 Transcript_21631/m.33067 type:complete len:347 (+) Transcript_21631:78-1118(+)
MVHFIWEKITPKPDPTHGSPCTRSSHGLSLIHSGGRLILYGGEHVARTPLEGSQATWAADWTGGTWTWRLIEGDCPPARVAHAQAAYDDKIVFVFGGRAGITMQEQAMNDLWKLDCSSPTETWSKVEAKGEIPEARSFHKMVCIGSELYVFGGCGAEHGRLADVHRFDITTETWYNMGASSLLRGRGGANFLPLASKAKLGVVAGFAGEETNDGHMYDVKAGSWEGEAFSKDLEGLRPRSVCVSGSFPSVGIAVIFGGEVDPSAKGHEGAGGFENDLVYLNEVTGKFLESTSAIGENWPETRGWADADGIDEGNGVGELYLFGGLSGDDSKPTRLDDLWRLQVRKA